MSNHTERAPTVDVDALTELPPTLENLHAKLNHLVVVREIDSRAIERLENGWEERLAQLRRESSQVRAIARNLSATAIKFFTVRAIVAVVPSGTRLAALFAGAAVGAFAATLVGMAIWGARVGHAVALLP